MTVDYTNKYISGTTLVWIMTESRQALIIFPFFFHKTYYLGVKKFLKKKTDIL